MIGQLLVYCDPAPPSDVTLSWKHVSPYLWNGVEIEFFPLFSRFFVTKHYEKYIFIH